MVAEALNEKPHFDPLAPGARDTFNFQIPLPGVPRYQSVTVAVAEVKRNSVTASR